MTTGLVVVLFVAGGIVVGLTTVGGFRAAALGAVTGVAVWLIVWGLYEVFVSGVSDNCDPSLSEVSKHCTR
ncbi:hypothetical protein [Nocardioides mangrovi]|uniref:Uncharacterized protein n=1 Tax=Nocardioides mangrovi TaxID=2874580 RepID=A0ABS7UI83_9ACTN|nr:hypothetical protein [Nocardioides mangrovi]MBZ5740741.1 hypothetical protein [Nocardioides mangrovi]